MCVLWYFCSTLHSSSLSLCHSALMFPSWLVLFCSFPCHLFSRATLLHIFSLTLPVISIPPPMWTFLDRWNPSFMLSVCVCACVVCSYNVLGTKFFTMIEVQRVCYRHRNISVAPIASWTDCGCHDMELMLSWCSFGFLYWMEPTDSPLP